MKNTWLRFSLLFIAFATSYVSLAQDCTFPESEIDPFFFDVPADTQPNSVIVDTVVDPPDAVLEVVNIRSNNLEEHDYVDRFSLEKRSNGQFMILTKKSLSLPDYPSYVNETYLYMTVSCNKKAYPLISIRIRNQNTFSPKFYNQPYEVTIPSPAAPSSIVETPILALDRDPSWNYAIAYRIEGGQFADEFSLEPSTTDFYRLKNLPRAFRMNARWHPEQLPPIVRLRVQRPLRQEEYYLNISATDNGLPPRTTYSTLHVLIGSASPHEYLKFTAPEYFANFSKLMQVDTEIVPNVPITAKMTELAPKSLTQRGGRPIYELMDSDFSDYFLLDPHTAQLTVRSKLNNDTPSTILLKIKAYLESDPSVETATTLALADISDNTLTYFTKCFYDAMVEENAHPDTPVLRLMIYGEGSTPVLLNATEYFRVEDDGRVFTEKALDREVTDTIVFQVKLVNNNPKRINSQTCTTATITVFVEDVNDNSPKFEKTNYVFYGEQNPFNNTEIGKVYAFDNDTGIYGNVHYRMLTDKSDDIPFILFPSDSFATIYYVQPYEEFVPEKIYTFPIEAYDSTEDPRTSRVSIQVIFGNKDLKEQEFLRDSPTTNGFDLPAASPIIAPKQVVVEKSKKAQPKTLIRPMSVEQQSVPEQFESSTYKFHIYGKLQEGQYVGTIRTTNSDKGTKYELEQGIRGFFKVDPSNGYITVASRLLEDDYEEIRFAAVAKKNGRIIANTLITVVLDDSISIYELTPRFEQSLYRFEVPENHEAVSIGAVQAHHRAVEINGDQIVYTMSPSEDANSFIVDYATGQVSTRLQLDREQKHLYSIEITGCLRSNSTLCGETQAAIVVTDINDNAPVFEQYKITISTDIEPGTDLVTIKASDADQGVNAQLHYELETNGNGRFSLDEDSGLLKFIGENSKLKENIRYNLKVVATDEGDPPLSSSTNVVVIVGTENQNPNAPVFRDFRYEVTLPSIVPANTKIITLQATDADVGENGEIRYSIAESTDSRQNRVHQLLSIDPLNGEINSKVLIRADVDGPLIQFVVEAADQSPTFPRKAETVVMLRFADVQTEDLEFVPLPKTVFISSEKQIGTEIIVVAAKTTNEEINHRVRYAIEQSTEVDLFGIPPNTGSLQVKRALQQGRFPITLKAFIPGTRFNATHNMEIIVMTDRNKYPVFESLSYEMQVPTNAAFPIKLDPLNATIASGHIEYSLFQAEKLPRGIQVDKMTGQLTVFEEFMASFDSSNQVFVVIRARNIDHPQFYSDVGVTLVLVDFATTLAFPAKLYRFVIAENKQQGTTLEPAIEVQNAQNMESVQYFVEPANSLFAINTRGELYLKKTIDLEELPPATQGIVEINVVAVAGSQRATAKVQIKVEDENEFAPIFMEDQYDFEIRHQPADNEVIGRVVAIDEDFSDRGKVKYEIIDRSGPATQIVDIQSNGTIVKKPGEEFRDGIYEMIVQASDFVGHSSEVVVSIYVRLDDKSTPQVRQFEQKWEPDSLTPPGDKFSIFGLPNSRWQFEITDGNDDHAFGLNEINETLAELEILSPMSMADRERTVNVELINLDNPEEHIMTNVHVDFSKAMDKSHLQFTNNPKTPITVTSENLNDVLLSAKVEPTTGSNEMYYEITQNPGGLFYIDSHTGDVMLSSPSSSLQPGKYEVQVKATALKNGEKTSHVVEDKFIIETKSLVHFEETTSVKPQETIRELSTPRTLTPNIFGHKTYNFVVDDAQPGAVVGKLDLVNNRPVSLEISPVDSRRYFSIRPRTNDLVLVNLPESSIELQEFVLNVTATDVGDPRLKDFAEVSVTLSVFGSSSTSQENIFLWETSTMEAVNGKDTYTSTQDSIATDSSETETTVDTVSNQETSPASAESEEISVSTIPVLETKPTDSNIRLSTVQDDSPVDSITPTVFNDDTVTASTSSSVEETTEIEFASNHFTAVLPEGKYGSGGKVLALKPFPLSQDLPSGTTYHIDLAAATNSSLPFTIREDNGDVIVYGELDRETVPVYEFVVYAFSPSAPDSPASAIVEVDILDVNDNAPEFVKVDRVVGLSTTAPAGAVVANFSAIDRDDGKLGDVEYVLQGKFSEFFSISDSGVVTLKQELPTNIPDKLSLAVVATDGGRPALKTTHAFDVELYSSQATEPQFKEAEYSADLAEGAQRGDYVIQVVAGLQNLTYAFENSYSDLFVVDDHGVVTLGRDPFDNERNRDYRLNLTATNNADESTSAQLTISLRGKPVLTTSPSSRFQDNTEQGCRFTNKVYNAEIPENTPERRLLVAVDSQCQNAPAGSQVVYYIHQGSDAFEINENTGELYVTKPLDRENRTLHFIVVNITLLNAGDENVVRASRQTPPIVEYARSKLSENQALIVIRVTDENDNAPQFTRLNSLGEYVFVVDWQLPVDQSIDRIQATDIDEAPQLTYSIENSEGYFAVDSQNGSVTLLKSLEFTDVEKFELTAKVTDGLHQTSAPLKIFPLMLGHNIVILASNKSYDNINENSVGLELSQSLNLVTRVLVKQAFRTEDNRFDPMKSHLLVYALQKDTHEPLHADELKKMLDDVSPSLQKSSQLSLIDVSLPNVGTGFQVSNWEISLIVISFILILTACITLCVLIKICKNRKTEKAAQEYMIDISTNGPRPYDVELISRRTAQTILANQTLPTPVEELKLSHSENGSRSPVQI